MDAMNNDDCEHYQRKCLLVAPCCEKVFSCRLCHDNVENHKLVRTDVDMIVCSQCKKLQKVSKNCSECGILFGKYSCLICRLFDDIDKKQFHCDLCGICRVGGRENYFHCGKCNMCLSLSIIDSHKCLEDASKKNCPVCLEDIHTSRKSVHVPKCSHLMHMECYFEMTNHNNYACPICNQSLMDMSSHWEHLDEVIAETTMPHIYQNYYVNILCRDCQGNTKVKFHVVGLKCQNCGSYNTTRTGGDEPIPDDPDNELQEVVDGLEGLENASSGSGEEDEDDDDDGWETVEEGDEEDDVVENESGHGGAAGIAQQAVSIADAENNEDGRAETLDETPQNNI